MRQKNYLDLSRWSFRFALACATEIKIPLGKSTKLKHNLWFTTTKHFAARCGGDVAAAKDDRNLSQDKVAVVVVYVMLFRRIVVVFALVVAVVGRPFVWFNRVRSPLGMVRRRVQCRWAHPPAALLPYTIMLRTCMCNEKLWLGHFFRITLLLYCTGFRMRNSSSWFF